MSVALAAHEFVGEFNFANPVPEVQTFRIPKPIWMPPPIDFCKLNIDVGCCSNGLVSWGLVIRNRRAEVLFAACKKSDLVALPVVVACFKGELSLASIDPFILDCKELLINLVDVSVSLIKRNCNEAAHQLAQVAKTVGSCTWVGNAPNLKVKCEVHNHGLPDQYAGHPRKARLTADENKHVEDLTKRRVAPSRIVFFWKEQNPESVVDATEIYRKRSRLQKEERGSRTVTQHLLQWLSLLEIVGTTSTDLTFAIGFAYMESKKTDNYRWALEELKGLFTKQDILPQVIVTDRELVLMNANEIVFPHTVNMLCTWHINKNVFSRCSVLVPKDMRELVKDLWKNVVFSSNEVEYQQQLNEFKQACVNSSKLVDYVKKSWMNPYKERFVAAWTNQVMHLGNRTTNSGYTLSGVPIPLDSIHSHWKKLTMEVPLEDDTEDDYELDMSHAFDAIRSRYRSLDIVGKRALKSKVFELAYPATSSLCPPPEQIKTRRGVKNKDKGIAPKSYDMYRDPSYFEHVER
ncbi:hypothetical protein TSUD_56510 [Trifolium subterraneum]|uniref:MULE transposase domain-containing protein n=1 Tax=Trifolium subterraneum TaxID=3900 RepID=A0A2Z6NGQ6_TRISU|nr:hypothetical protein TSUD_56510 [Trifolium subterraneum]